MNVVILGATKGMGRALARHLAERGDTVFLLGRDREDLERSAADLAVRTGRGATPGVAVCDLERPDTFTPALDRAWEHLGKVDVVVVTAALFALQDALEADAELTRRVLTVDYVSTVLFCEEARKRLLAAGGGTLCVFSSVAGDRGRGAIGLYGSAKAGLSAYLEALDHRYHKDGLTTICVKPGFVKTGATAGLKPPPFAGEPEGVARDVAAAIDKKTPVVYTPAPWWGVMAIIRTLPRAVMRKLSF